jgi:hypothetical protein
MHGSLEGPALRLKQRPDKEAMTVELKTPSFAFRRTRGDLHRAVFEEMFELRIQPVIATKPFFTGVRPIRFTECTRLRNEDLSRCFHERALQVGEQGKRGVGICFRMLGLRKPKNISGVFQQGMLKAAARAKKGDVMLARKLDGPERSFGIAIGACRDTPKSAEVLKSLQIPWNN